jgi:hypothetical protein
MCAQQCILFDAGAGSGSRRPLVLQSLGRCVQWDVRGPAGGEMWLLCGCLVGHLPDSGMA